MKGRKPILCVWIPDLMEAKKLLDLKKRLISQTGNQYHVLCISNFNNHAKLKIELLGTRKLSRAKYQTILNAINNENRRTKIDRGKNPAVNKGDV